MKLHTLIGCFACVLGLTTWSHAQAIPTASRNASLQIGGGVSYAKSDYGHAIGGLTVYGDYDFTRHIGVEGDIHFTNLWTPGDVGQKTYLLGPRYKFYYHGLNPYAKALFGIGQLQFQRPSMFPVAATYTYGAYAFGGGVDWHATRHINVRAFDFEYQRWPSAGRHGLTPIVMTVGVAYAFH